MIEIENIKKFSKKLRKNILYMAKVGGSHAAHIGGALSIIDILSTLFSNFFHLEKNSDNRDRFILSKGHACLALYAILYEKGLINKEHIETFEQSGSDLLGHPVKNRKIGIDFSTGSLGMGLSLATGVAISLKKKNIDRKVYVVIGDGECNEGSIWEAAMSGYKYELNNLVAIIDKNGLQQTGRTKEIMDMNSLEDKWKSFGWNVIVADGHNIRELLIALNKEKKLESKKPTAIVANTTKGKGISFIENDNTWHHNLLTKNQYKTAISELGFNND